MTNGHPGAGGPFEGDDMAARAGPGGRGDVWGPAPRRPGRPQPPPPDGQRWGPEPGRGRLDPGGNGMRQPGRAPGQGQFGQPASGQFGQPQPRFGQPPPSGPFGQPGQPGQAPYGQPHGEPSTGQFGRPAFGPPGQPPGQPRQPGQPATGAFGQPAAGPFRQPGVDPVGPNGYPNGAQVRPGGIAGGYPPGGTGPIPLVDSGPQGPDLGLGTHGFGPERAGSSPWGAHGSPQGGGVPAQDRYPPVGGFQSGHAAPAGRRGWQDPAGDVWARSDAPGWGDSPAGMGQDPDDALFATQPGSTRALRQRVAATGGARVKRVWPQRLAVACLIAVALVVCWYWIFPWLENILPSEF